MASESLSRSGGDGAASSTSSASRKRSASGQPRNPRRSPFTDFGSYMTEKNRKLRHQFDSEASRSSTSGGGGGGQGAGIFHGVSIFVDGFTVPSSQELRSIMMKHGGRLENYFSRHRVTHIVCSNLPDSKMRNFRAFSRGLPVVKPAWVVESVAANKLLSWVPYQVDDLVHGAGRQQKLSSFFNRKSISSSQDSEPPIDPNSFTLRRVPYQVDDLVHGAGRQQKLSSFFNRKSISSSQDSEPPIDPNSVLNPEGSCGGEEPKPLLLSREGEFCDDKRQHTERPCTREEICFEEPNEESKSVNLEDEYSVIEAADSSPSKTSIVSSGDHTDNKMFKEGVDVVLPEDHHQRHSIARDPSFVENYFKKSRLHFIGTWRNRYRKRFCSMISEAKHNNRSPGFTSSTHRAAIIHIDMDCFFVSVVVRNYPELLDKPVAVCHSDNPKGTAEISSANYPARDYGIRAGMFVRDAKARCPHLVIFPYDFKAYEEVADQFYSILHKHCNKVQALSCDEAYLGVTQCGGDDPEQIALKIRKEIVEATRCTASAGIAGNLLLARLATKSAKPNGQYFIPPEKVDNYLKDLPVKELPGVGYALAEKLKRKQIQTCGQLRLISKEVLQMDFGMKSGDMLWNYCRGVDNRSVEVVQETKSVGAEVNWGVRFNDITDCHRFLMTLCKEVSLRLGGCGVQGRTVTLKVKKRRKGADEPVKFMGCGDCESLSRTMTLPSATDNITVLQRISKQIFASFCIDVKEVRGVGLQISRLENVDITSQGHEDNRLQQWLASASETIKEHETKPTSSVVCSGTRVEVPLHTAEPQPSCKDFGNQNSNGNSAPRSVSEAGPSSSHIRICNTAANESNISTLPPLCHLDVEVIKNLPPDIISEMNEVYDGRLCDLIEKHRAKDSTMSLPEGSSTNPLICCNGDLKRDVITTVGLTDSIPDIGPKSLGKQPICDLPTPSKALVKTIRHASFTSSSCDDLPINTAGADRLDLMPSSLSQADVSVLQQLPEELKTDVINSLPAHRRLDYINNMKCANLGACDSKISKFELWVGKPPHWVEKFKRSSCLILNVIAEMYSESGVNSLLSSILQSLVSFLPLSANSCDENQDEAFSSLCELLMQYIDLKIDSDIEELYICFCHLKRFSSLSKVLLQIYMKVLPYLQADLHAATALVFL